MGCRLTAACVSCSDPVSDRSTSRCCSCWRWWWCRPVPAGPALLASVLSIAAFDFVFVPPYYTFNVHDGAYFLTFGVMLVVALIMSRPDRAGSGSRPRGARSGSSGPRRCTP